MTARFDLDFVTFRCKHAKCGEVFEKSLGDLARLDDAICPRCGTPTQIGEDNHLLASTSTPSEIAPTS